MICCEKCFKDSEIKGIIKSLHKKGTCETCNKKDVYIYDTETNGELVDNFNELLDIYKPLSMLPEEYPKEKLNLLKDVLFNEWNIFNISSEKIYSLIKSICYEKYEETPELFDSPIGIPELIDYNYLESNSIIKNHQWENFVDEIKTNIRFHTNFVNTEVLKVLCSYIERPIKRGSKLYRARISSEDGYTIDKMGAPPPGKASAGRVNPLGINYLYLSEDIKTTLYEVRAGAYDYVTVGEFILKEDITIIDFTSLDKISPFTDISITQLAINKNHLKKISNEIAKPLRRADSTLDYLPTQYIADFIKSIIHKDGKSYKGIKYKSTLSEYGYNIAIFDETLFGCMEKYVFDIEGIDYRYSPLTE
ncbi:RES family NAD+ phosphorylase [Mesobacillus jeotgali]|uniref:RES family NAD+ phosphorylase n=1 Tax=Mesobacillus jeotgali TaxID=129985 RepID=UPI00177C0784|nr:RES family NAD+ phosphorylase [Mesobacillus jeotgali]UYZ22528.1 RES family NAD+ phosphorylase [Mesobacillus jeotgali]